MKKKNKSLNENKKITTRKIFPYFNIDGLRVILNCIIATFFSLLISLLLHSISSFMGENSLLAELVSNVNEEWYMNSFFSDKNSSPQHHEGIDFMEIIKIDDSYSSRSDIAKVVWAVAAQKPKLICLDMIFPEGQSYDKVMNKYLLDTISIVRQTVPIVVASYKGCEQEIRHSYFTDTLNLEYGLVDFEGFKHFTYSIDGHLRLSSKVAQMAGVNLSKLPQNLVINYKEKEFSSRFISESEELNHLTDLTGKIVLIGQRYNPDDMHNTPFLIDQNHKIPGIDIVAYEIGSLLVDSNSPVYNRLRPYSYCNTFPNILLFICMSLIFYICYHFIRKMQENHQIWFQWQKFILLIIVEYLIIKGCFLLTDWLFIIPNIVLFMLSVLLVEPIYETANYLTHKYFHL